MAEVEDSDKNSITLIDLPDREIEVKPGKPPAIRRNISQVTGLKNSESYQPILVEFNNENGGVFATAPQGITKASVIYEYQTSTNGTMGISALFQDEFPETVGPIGNATIGGVLLQDDWKCGYVYNDIPSGADGEVTELGYSIQMWMDNHDLAKNHLAFQANVSKTKEWKQFFKMDPELIVDENQLVNLPGIKGILDRNKNVPSPAGFSFMSKPEKFSGDTYVNEIDLRSPSRTFTSWFVYNQDEREYYRWVGENNMYGDVKADEALHVTNVIVQRVNYTTSNKNMAPITIGKGNAEIFIGGYYIDGYWVRESENDRTQFYDADGNPLQLAPGKTYIALLSNSASVVILNY